MPFPGAIRINDIDQPENGITISFVLERGAVPQSTHYLEVILDTLKVVNQRQSTIEKTIISRLKLTYKLPIYSSQSESSLANLSPYKHLGMWKAAIGYSIM